jgi:membrane associated rhomboid family serine protease
MTDAARNPDDYCYRHPDRLSFALCEQCGRTICLECQTHVGGKVLCPDDARRSNVTMIGVNRRPPRAKQPPSRTNALLERITPETPIINYVYAGILVVIWIADAIAGAGNIEAKLWFVDNLRQPWTIITHAFSEYPGGQGFLSILFNAFTLWFLGRRVEMSFGRLKFLMVLGASTLGASAIAMLLNGLIIDAGDAIFGLVGAGVVLIRRGGSNMMWIYISIAVSFLSILLSPSGAVLWQGAVGGLLAGSAVGLSFALDSNPREVTQQRLIAAAVFLILLVLIVAKYLIPTLRS